MLMKIYEIIIKDANKYFTQEKKNITIDMNSLSDNTLQEIKDYLDNNKKEEEKIDHHYVPYVVDDTLQTLGAKMSNQEKSIIRRKNLGDLLSDQEFHNLDVGNMTSDTDNTDDDIKTKKKNAKITYNINQELNKIMENKTTKTIDKKKVLKNKNDSSSEESSSEEEEEIIISKPKPKSNRGRKPKNKVAYND